MGTDTLAAERAAVEEEAQAGRASMRRETALSAASRKTSTRSAPTKPGEALASHASNTHGSSRTRFVTSAKILRVACSLFTVHVQHCDSESAMRDTGRSSSVITNKSSVGALGARGEVRNAETDLAVEAARTPERRVERVHAVRGADEQHTAPRRRRTPTRELCTRAQHSTVRILVRVEYVYMRAMEFEPQLKPEAAYRRCRREAARRCAAPSPSRRSRGAEWSRRSRRRTAHTARSPATAETVRERTRTSTLLWLEITRETAREQAKRTLSRRSAPERTGTLGECVARTRQKCPRRVPGRGASRSQCRAPEHEHEQVSAAMLRKLDGLVTQSERAHETRAMA